MKCPALLGLSILLFSSVPAVGQEAPPPWAYPVNPPDFKPEPDDGGLRRVPNSNASYTLTQVRDLFRAPVWHPEDHPPLPQIVASGRRPDVQACGVCHRADGPGGPENSSLAGLPAAYIIQQMADFKSGARTTSVPQRVPPKLMIGLAKSATDAEVQAAAEYFSVLKPRTNIKVVETDTVLKSYVVDRGRYALTCRVRCIIISLGMQHPTVARDVAGIKNEGRA